MRLTAFLLIALLAVAGCKTRNGSAPPSPVSAFPDTTDATNDFYDNTPTYPLSVTEIAVGGEISNPGMVKLSDLPLHSIFVKEAVLDSSGNTSFTGAYRYDGYSLYDILNKCRLQKANAKEFNPIIDLFVEIENAKGEKAVFSWGEIYYPNTSHRIILANGVARIVPSKSKDLWPLPVEPKIVAGNDLITERNISSPVKITVRSYPRSFTVDRNISPLYSKDFSLYDAGKKIAVLAPLTEKEDVVYNTIFYGRGRGIHTTTPFYGMLMKNHLQKYFPVSSQNIRTGMVCFSALDGYRCAVSWSELFNRNDQQEFLLVRTEPGEDGGLFRVFPAADFFSDRAIKSLTGVWFDLF